MVEVQKLEVFCDFCGARATLCGNPREVQKLEVFCDFCCSNWSSGVVSSAPGTGGSRVRFFLVRGRASPDATCIKQLAQSNLRRATCAEQVAQSNLRRPTCTDQFAQSALPRATCAEQLTQSNLHSRATCRDQLARSNLHRATCREPLAGTNLHGATSAEQLAPSNLHSATCVEQLAQTNLHRPVCAEHLAWCCLALASRMLRVGKENASCSSVGPTSLAMLFYFLFVRSVDVKATFVGSGPLAAWRPQRQLSSRNVSRRLRPRSPSWVALWRVVRFTRARRMSLPKPRWKEMRALSLLQPRRLVGLVRKALSRAHTGHFDFSACPAELFAS